MFIGSFVYIIHAIDAVVLQKCNWHALRRDIWLLQSPAHLQVSLQVDVVDVTVGLLSSRHQFEQNHSVRPLDTRKASEWVSEWVCACVRVCLCLCTCILVFTCLRKLQLYVCGIVSDKMHVDIGTGEWVLWLNPQYLLTALWSQHLGKNWQFVRTTSDLDVNLECFKDSSAIHLTGRGRYLSIAV